MSYILDWASVDIDGDNTLSDGTNDIGVTISTPVSGKGYRDDDDDWHDDDRDDDDRGDDDDDDCPGTEWEIGFIKGDSHALRSKNVTEPTKVIVEFDRDVTDVEFELYDVDCGHGWDDKVTIIALDAHGNQVPVVFENTIHTHAVDGNVIEGEGNDSPGVEGPGKPDTVTVKIAGPIVSLTVIHDNGDSNDSSGTVGLSDLHFHAAPERDGIVTGTEGDDLIDETYVDQDGDVIDGGDAIIPGDGPDDDRVEALGGDDTVKSGAGNDSVNGGSGDDLIITGATGSPDLGYPPIPGDADPFDDRDFADGGSGNDTIFGGDDDDTLLGGVGDDQIDGGFDRDDISAGDGDDLVIGGEGSDIITGGDGNDTIFGGLGPDVPDIINIPDSADEPFPAPDKVTDNGRDLIDGGAGNDLIFGEDDDDTILGGEGSDTIDGGIDDDSVNGGADNDVLLGNQGDDTLIGADGSDIIIGGAGSDLSIGDGAVGEGNTPGGARDALFGGGGDDTLIGGSGDDTIVSGEGADVQSGGDDRDLFFEVGVGDEVSGGEGGDDFDTMALGSAGIIIGEEGDPEAGTVVYYDLDTLTEIGTSDFEEIERVVFVEDLPVPEPDPDRTLPGPPQGGDGYVDGTDGDDLIDLDYDGDPEGDVIDGGDAILPGEGPDDDIVLAGDGNDTVEAGLGDDEVFGGDGNDLLDGESGDDVLRGEDGNDTILGGTGSDKLSGGDGNDELEGGDDRDTLEGGDGNDVLLGGGGNDFLTGGEGNDTLDGGAGSNLLAGGDGNDEFELGGDSVPDLAFGQDDADTFRGVGAGDTIVGGEGGDDFDTIDPTSFGTFNVDWRVAYTGGDPASESGTIEFLDGAGNVTGTAEFSEIEAICFTPGTRIATPNGERLAEELCAGDKVLTRDNGVQEIAWYGQTGLNAADFAARPHLTPVLIKAGALGNGLPERDIMVSPQHRVLVSSDRAAYYFDEREVLVAAKHLVNGRTILRRPVPQTTYIHFMCERHEVVLSDGAWSESFQPGDFSLNGIADAQRDEILELFPELRSEAGLRDYAAARRSLKRHEAVLLTR